MVKKDIHFYFDMDGTVNEFVPNADTHSEHYFLHCKAIPSSLKAMRILHDKGYNVSFGTSAYTHGTAMADKSEWVKMEGYNDIPIIFIPYGENKDTYLKDGEIRVLIDDHTPNLMNFSGIGVKFINQINHKKGIWTGPCVRHDMSGEEIASALINLLHEKSILV